MKEGFEDRVYYYFGYFAVLLLFNLKYPVEGMKGTIQLTILKTGCKQQKRKEKLTIYCSFQTHNK